MKKLLLLLLFSMALSAKGQTSVYHPFPDSNAVWNVHYFVYLGCPMALNDNRWYSFQLNGDTLINNKTYHKLFIPFIKYSCYTSHAVGYIGCIIQDTLNKKVYIIPQGGNTERLLYDFNMQVGDTVKGFLSEGSPCFDPSSYPRIITSVDSILIDNNYRKRWNIDGGRFSFIEGIGSTDGLLEPICEILDKPDYELTCFKQNGITLYPDSNTVCDLISSVNNLSVKNISITLSPNPFHTTATLRISELGFTNYDLKIYDVMGKLVKRQAIVNRKSEIVNREGLSDGIYFYQLETRNAELLGSGKFVVN